MIRTCFTMLLVDQVCSTRSDTRWASVDVQRSGIPQYIHPKSVQYSVLTAGGKIAFSWVDERMYRESIPADFDTVTEYVTSSTDALFREMLAGTADREIATGTHNNIVNVKSGVQCIASVILSSGLSEERVGDLKQVLVEVHAELKSIVLLKADQRLSTLGQFDDGYARFTSALQYPLRALSIQSAEHSLTITSSMVIYKEIHPQVILRLALPPNEKKLNQSFSRFFDWTKLFLSTLTEVDDVPQLLSEDVVLSRPFSTRVNTIEGHSILYEIDGTGRITIKCPGRGLHSFSVRHRDESFARNLVFLLGDERGFWKVNWSGVGIVCEGIYS